MLLPLAAGLALWEGGHAVARFQERGRMYAAAQARAKELGRLLVVVGDPDAGAHTRLKRAYGCGDVCVDLNGCPDCPASYRVELGKQRIPMEDSSAVVFVSCVLEYVDDVEAAWAELVRVSGGEVFPVLVSRFTLTSRLFPGAKWVLKQVPGGLAAKRISNDMRDGSRLADIVERYG